MNHPLGVETTGIAAIPVAKLSSNNELYIEYKYTSGNEKRTGKTRLHLTEPNHFEGTWKTIADNGTIYSGSLYFDFKENGEASGKYEFSGVNYNISIQLNN